MKIQLILLDLGECCSKVNPLLKSKVYDISLKVLGKNFDKQYDIIKNLSDKQELDGFIRFKFDNLIKHSYRNSTYYNKTLESIIHEADQGPDKLINKIPILTKDILRDQGINISSKDLNTRKWFYNTSGGSTGEPIKFIQDDIFNKWMFATVKYYYLNILGIDEQASKKIVLWGSEQEIFRSTIGVKAKISNWLLNLGFINSFRMTENDMLHCLNKINSFKPDLIRGYASSLYEISNFAERRNIKVHTPKVIVSAAETLGQEVRESIERVFGARVYDFYGSREVDGLAGECNSGYRHIFAFNNYIEILDDNNNPVNEGQEGRVIVTNLCNYSMPMIRYEIGDTAVLGPKKCKCGNPLPTLAKITGRITDNFIKEDNTIIYGEYFTHLFFMKSWVKRFQVIQEDYKRIRIVLELSSEIIEAEKNDIEEKIKLVLGKDCYIKWEIIDQITYSRSGKHIYTKTLVNR